MDSRWRDKLQAILDDMRCCDPSKTVHWAHRIEDVLKEEREQPILPPQRSMTPEESANLAAYHKTIFKRVVAQGDELREEVPIIHGRAELVAHDAALRASVREEAQREIYEEIAYPKWHTDYKEWAKQRLIELALASEKAAPEEVAQASNELGTCDILSEPHETGFTYSPTHLHLCSNWRPLPKGDAK